MSRTNLVPIDSEKWNMEENMDCHKFGKYLRENSNGYNTWTYKNTSHGNLFFSPNGKLIAVVTYSGSKLLQTKTFTLKDKNHA